MDPTKRRKNESEVVKRSGHSVLDFLSASGLLVDRLEPLSDKAYVLFLQLTTDARSSLGLRADQLLAVVLHHQTQQHWFLGEARSRLHNHDGLAKTAVLVLSDDIDIERKCEGAHPDPSSGYKTAYVAVRLDKISGLTSQVDRSVCLFEAFRKQAFSVDYFDAAIPVPDDLFGRNPIVSQLEQDIYVGTKGIAILGIRRAGKTSVLKRVLKQVRARQDQGWLVAECDAQNHSIDVTAELVAGDWTRGLRQEAERHGLDVHEPAGDSALVRLGSMLRHLIDTNKKHVLLALDEVEWMIPSGAQVAEEELRLKEREYLRLFAFLRSQKQTHGGSVSIVVCGINETFCELAEVGSMSNPSLDWYTRYYVKPLPEATCDAMLRVIGQRMRVSLSGRFLSRAWTAFAGHPYLVRQFCSAAVAGRAGRPIELGDADFETTYKGFIDHAEGVIRQVLSHLARFYPEEYSALRSIALGGPMARISSTTLRHLSSYGLVVTGEALPSLTMGIVEDFVRSRSVEDVRVERFVRLRQLGLGATGDVWQAFDRVRKSQVALKIYRAESSKTLARREYLALKALTGTCTPEPYELLMFDNLPAIAMEYIEAPSLRTLLDERGSLSHEELHHLSSAIFSAVSQLHTREGNPTSSGLEGREGTEAWDYFALCRGGVLHRDLKPENMLVVGEIGEGVAVRLLDVQFAQAFDEAGLSIVGTPAYMPLDVGDAKWDATFDLFAIGIMLFECAYGRRPALSEIRAGNWDEARRIHVSYGGVLVKFFQRALAPQARLRFQSVSDMSNEWSDVLVALA